MRFYDIIALILTGMCSPLGRDIDPGETSRRRFCATQTRRSPEILPLFQARRTTWLRDVRTRLGRLLVFMYSSLACGRATGEYRKEGARRFFCIEHGALRLPVAREYTENT